MRVAATESGQATHPTERSPQTPTPQSQQHAPRLATPHHTTPLHSLSDSEMDFEKILGKCGDCHRYQYMLMALYGFLMFVVSRHYFAQNVISFVPDHWCHHPDLEHRSFEEIAAIYSQFENPSCTRLASIDPDGGNATASSEPCDRWIYNYDFGFRSMNAELNWVCDAAYKARVGQSLFFVGSMCGTLIFGLLGDTIGRIKAMILANWCGFLGDSATIFAQSLVTFSVSRFVSGLAAEANAYLMYILALEYVSPSLRNVGLNLILSVFYSLGMISASWQAVWVGEWRTFMAWSAVPLLLVTLFYFLVQESAQWLVTRHDIDGAVLRLRRVAHFNRRVVSEEDFEQFRVHCKGQESTSSHHSMQRQSKLMDALKTPRLRLRMINVLLVFTIITLCYNTVSRNVEGLGLSPFIMFTLFALTLPPSGLFQAQAQKSMGRKFTAVSSMVATGLMTAACGILLTFWKQPSPVLLVALILTSRFGISVCTGATMQISAELVPTCVRSGILAVAHVSGAAFSFVSPFILHLDTYFRAASSIIICLLLFASAWICLLMPETRNKKLPMSLAEGEQFGKGERMFDFLRRPKKEDEADLSAETHQKLVPE
ncbi:organic cation transporter-like protein isoform X1 [Drosophila miranda]|uniref:organic cation transporter-like protein isoform X1 n=2 Tax=Drosophila miranda TaxID=7229 RepID=UPI00143F4117|nr:organic cation transporter-like protein isoform X1 [Drosophila miranda]